MSCKITPEFRDEFSKLLELKDKSANEQLQLLVGCLKAHKMIYMVENIEPKFFMTHKANRGGLLLSPHNVHRNGARIAKVGADFKQLTNALCMELSELGPLRDEHIAANATLIARSDGLLAPLNGGERYVSLGCGHTVAFCKQAAIKGSTVEKSIKIPNGGDTIDLQMLCKNQAYASMIMHGWSWDVVPAIIDQMFPAFAVLAQKALNTQNHISTEVGELETCMTLAATARDPGMKALDGWKDIAIENVVSLCVPSSKYASTLLEFVLNYGGGEDAYLIAFMDSVSKQFGCNATMGQTYWESVTTATFNSKTKFFPLVRVALLLANLTGDKVEDGIARLLSRIDIVRVASKPMFLIVEAAEVALEQAISIASGPMGGIDTALRPLGQMFVRMGLKLTSKEKQGREKVVYDLPQICQAYLTDLSALVGKKVEFAGWSAAAEIVAGNENAAGSKNAVHEKTHQQATLADHKDPVWIAGRAGFAIGQIVVGKDGPGTADRLYTIFSIDPDGNVNLHQVCNYTGGPPDKVPVALDVLIEKWKTTKQEPPVMMDGGQQRPGGLQVDRQKGLVFRALLDADAKGGNKFPMLFWRKPDEVRNECAIKVGQLSLFPVVPYTNITSKASPNAVKCDGCFILPVQKPPVEAATTTFKPDAVVAAFWWVAATSDKKEANMAMEYVNQSGIQIPVLKNTVDLAPHTKLCMWKPQLAKDKAGAPPAKAVAPKPAAAKPNAAKKQRTV